LSEQGYLVQHWPLTRLDQAANVDWSGLIGTLQRCRWALLPSPGAIEIVMSALKAHRLAWPSTCGIGLIGPGSRAALEAWQGRVPGLATVPRIEPQREPFDAEALLSHPELRALQDKAVAVLRRDEGQQAWLQTLRERGAVLQVFNVYTMSPQPLSDEARQWVADRARAHEGYAISVASAQTGKALAQAIPAGTSNGVHDRVRMLPASMRQLDALLRPDGRITHPCDGPCDPE
jgi:uroporphyrinogen-III synthase